MPSTKATATIPGFGSLGLAESLVAAVTALGYEEATPVQREAIPPLLAGRDLLGQAATGTGKTAAFALPMIHRLMTEQRAPEQIGTARDSRDGRTRGLVLVPTRELAMQVAEATHKYARGTGLCVVPLYGGASMPQQIRALDRGADIVVATPGRALDHLRRGIARASMRSTCSSSTRRTRCSTWASPKTSTRFSSRRPTRRQTALFSATMPPRLRSIAERHLHDPERIAIAREKTAAGKIPRVRQVAYIVAPRAQSRGAAARAGHGEPDVRARVLPHAPRGGFAGRNAQRPRLSCRGPPRRHAAAAARCRHGPLSRREG